MVTQADDNEVQYLSEMVRRLKYDVKRLEAALEVTTRERDAYKAYVDKIVQLKTEALLYAPMPSIVVDRPIHNE